MKLRDHFMSKVAAGAVALTLSASGAVFAQSNDTDANIVTNDSITERLNPANYELNPHQLVSPEMDPYIIGGAAGLFALLCLAGVARRKPGSSLLMLGAGVAVTGALLNPGFVSKEMERRPTEVAVVVDQSASQSLETRAEETRAVTENILAQLRAMGIDDANIHLVMTDGENEHIENGGTNIFTSLPASLSAMKPHQAGAVIYIGDGVVHDVPEEARGIMAQAPFYGVISGSEEERDRYIDLEDVPLFGIVDDEQTISFRVVDEGVPEAQLQPVEVTVKIDGAVYQQMTVIPNELSTITFDIEHGGENIIEIETAELQDELTTRNNATAFSIEGVRENMNVLLAVGEPYAGSISWRMALKSDPNIDLVHFNILRGQGQGRFIPVDEMSLIAFPTRELFDEKIEDFDLIILDSIAVGEYLTPYYVNRIREYVMNGGALLVVADQEYSTFNGVGGTALADIMPAGRSENLAANGTPFRPEISDYGERHPVTRGVAQAQDPEEWGRWFRVVDVGDVTGDILMQAADDRPLLIMDHAGEGRVALMASNQAWLWQRGIEGGGPYLELLRNVAHWTMAEPALEEEALRLRNDDGMLVVERQTMADVDSIAPAVITDPEGHEREVQLEEVMPGLWRGQIAADEPGLYAASHEELETATSVGLINPLEYRNMLSTEETLAPLAEETGGSVMRFNRNAVGAASAPRLVALEGDQVAGEGEIGIRMNEETILRGSERQSIPPWIYLLAAMGFVAGAYAAEGRRSQANKKTAEGAPKPEGP
ncbi:MAG: hypothetical protein VXY16_00585 [Pseudomonadota bacterium]|nr:hypothetical protein [Pseudomonadota bacterium]